MRAIYWLRSRQEEGELNYWLALVAYNRRDRSLNNRIYLVYLLLFFSIWVFITLTFFASGGAALLEITAAGDPTRGAAFLQSLLLCVWSVYGLWEAVRRSPVTFSEQDAVLACQTPIGRRHVVLRWFVMPWLKSAVPFWLVAVTLGFSLAELLLPGEMAASRIIEYSLYGLRAWLAVIPLHLGLYALQWVVGVFRLQKDFDRRWLAWVVIPAALILAVLVIMSCTALPGVWSIVGWAAFPIRAGFGAGSLAASLVVSGGFAASMLGVLARISKTFSLSRAAQETQEQVAVSTASQYGFVSLAQNMQTKKRLGVEKAPTRLPGFRGPAALLWKDLVQSVRIIRVQTVFEWLMLFALMFSLPFLPDLSSRAFVLACWIIQVSRLSVIRLQSDLSKWALARQLPIAHWYFLMFDLLLAYLVTLSFSLAGLTGYSLLSATPVSTLAAIVPGLAAFASGLAAVGVLRSSRSSLLLTGSVPEVGAGSVLIGIILALVPFVITVSLPGLLGTVLAAFLSLLFGASALLLAIRSYQRITA